MKNLVIATAILSVLGLGVSALWADTATPTTKPHNSRLVRHLEKMGLTLTEPQIVKLNDIDRKAHAAAKAVLTADQLKIIVAAEGQGHAAEHAAWQEVRKTLTAGQKTKLEELRKATWLEAKAVLTPEQLAQVEAFHKEHHKGASQPAPTE
jgi:Spy/CpxP family protein refolding chaperone